MADEKTLRMDCLRLAASRSRTAVPPAPLQQQFGLHPAYFPPANQLVEEAEVFYAFVRGPEKKAPSRKRVVKRRG